MRKASLINLVVILIRVAASAAFVVGFLKSLGMGWHNGGPVSDRFLIVLGVLLFLFGDGITVVGGLIMRRSNQGLTLWDLSVMKSTDEDGPSHEQSIDEGASPDGVHPCREGHYPYPDENVFTVVIMAREKGGRRRQAVMVMTIVARKPEVAASYAVAVSGVSAYEHLPARYVSLATLKTVKARTNRQRAAIHDAIEAMQRAQVGHERDSHYATDHAGGEDREQLAEHKAAMTPEQREEFEQKIARRIKREQELQNLGLLD